MASVLVAAGYDDDLESVSVAPIGTGQMATSLRVQLTYATTSSGGPDSVVVKIASEHPTSREAGARGAYLREVRYYEQIDATVQVATPGALFSAMDLDTNDFVVVLEDMSPAVQGDQIKGCSADDALLAALNIAGLHAPRWCDASLFELDWLTVPHDQQAESYREAQAIMGLLTPGFIARYRSRMSDREAELLQWFADHTEEWMHNSGDHFSLTHADHRLDNLLFTARPDAANTVTVVDWQTVGVRNPLTDISYLLGTGLDTALRREVEVDIVSRYRDRLIELGVAHYSFERCFDDYRAQTLHALLITVLGSMMTGQTDRGDEMFMAMLHRSSQQIFDLDAV